jgi:hypothetical protein
LWWCLNETENDAQRPDILGMLVDSLSWNSCWEPAG